MPTPSPNQLDRSQTGTVTSQSSEIDVFVGQLSLSVELATHGRASGGENTRVVEGKGEDMMMDDNQCDDREKEEGTK